MVADPDKRIELTKSYIEKAKTDLNSAEIFAYKNNLKSAIEKTYDSCYALLNALGMHSKFEAKNPDRLINWFKKRFVNHAVFDLVYFDLIIEAYHQKNNGSESLPTTEQVNNMLNSNFQLIKIIDNYIFPKPKRGRKPKTNISVVDTSKNRKGRKPNWMKIEKK